MNSSEIFHHTPSCGAYTGRHALPSPPPSPTDEYMHPVANVGKEAQPHTSPLWLPMPPSTWATTPPSPPLAKHSSEFPCLPSPASSSSSMVFEMDDFQDEPPSDPRQPIAADDFKWPDNMPTTCLLGICSYLSLSDLAEFSRTCRAMYISLSRVRNSILSQRLLQGRHLSADLYAAFLSGEAPYEGLAAHPAAFGGRSEVFKRLRGDQRIVDAFVGALISCVSNARAESGWDLGRNVVIPVDQMTEPTKIWDEGKARIDAVRGLLLLWPIIEAIKAASIKLLEEPLQPMEPDIPIVVDGPNEDNADLCEVIRSALEKFSTEALKLTWYINHHVARQVAIRFQLAGWVAPPYHEGMNGPLLMAGRDRLTFVLARDDDDECVKECIQEFERTMVAYHGNCPLRTALENELWRRGLNLESTYSH